MQCLSHFASGLLVAVRLFTMQPALFGLSSQEWLLLGEDFLFPGRVRTPLVRGHHSSARCGRTGKKVEPHSDDRPLHGDIERLTAGIAERKVGEDEARHAAMFDEVTCTAKHHVGQATSF